MGCTQSQNNHVGGIRAQTRWEFELPRICKRVTRAETNMFIEPHPKKNTLFIMPAGPGLNLRRSAYDAQTLLQCYTCCSRRHSSSWLFLLGFDLICIAVIPKQLFNGACTLVQICKVQITKPTIGQASIFILKGVTSKVGFVICTLQICTSVHTSTIIGVLRTGNLHFCP